jgi:hypothetical protein
MPVQHRLIPDAELHEPKGASSASVNTSYFSNGAGSGSWKKVGSSELAGLAGDGAVAGKKLLTNGSNGFALFTENSYGVMGVTNNTTNFAVTAAADSTLMSTADYVLYTGVGAPLVGESLYGVGFTTDRLTASVAGVYEVRMWVNVSVFPTNTARLGFKFRVNGTTWSPRSAILKSNANGDNGTTGAFGFVTLAADDYVQFFIASSASGNAVIQNLNLTLELKRAT